MDMNMMRRLPPTTPPTLLSTPHLLRFMFRNLWMAHLLARTLPANPSYIVRARTDSAFSSPQGLDHAIASGAGDHKILVGPYGADDWGSRLVPTKYRAVRPTQCPYCPLHPRTLHCAHYAFTALVSLRRVHLCGRCRYRCMLNDRFAFGAAALMDAYSVAYVEFVNTSRTTLIMRPDVRFAAAQTDHARRPPPHTLIIPSHRSITSHGHTTHPPVRGVHVPTSHITNVT
jgi:hypothetical protein